MYCTSGNRIPSKVTRCLSYVYTYCTTYCTCSGRRPKPKPGLSSTEVLSYFRKYVYSCTRTYVYSKTCTTLTQRCTSRSTRLYSTRTLHVRDSYVYTYVYVYVYLCCTSGNRYCIYLRTKVLSYLRTKVRRKFLRRCTRTHV